MSQDLIESAPNHARATTFTRASRAWASVLMNLSSSPSLQTLLACISKDASSLPSPPGTLHECC